MQMNAGQIDGSAKSCRKQSIGPRSDDPKKIEWLFKKIDGTGLLLSLVDDVQSCLESTTNNANGQCVPSSAQFAIDMLEFVVSNGKQQLNGMRKLVNNSKADQHINITGRQGALFP